MGLFDFTMKNSIKNRNIIALFAFFIFDHVIWYYCGFFEHISLFYVIASELIRIIALYGIIACWLEKNCTNTITFIIITYCFLMLPFTFFAGRAYYYADGSLLDNVLYIRKEKEIPIDCPIISALCYMYFMSAMYYFAWKYTGKK